MRNISRRTILKTGAVAGSGIAASSMTPSNASAETKTITTEFTIAGFPATAILEIDRDSPGNDFAVAKRRLYDGRQVVELRFGDGSPLPVRKFTVDVALPFKDLHRIWYSQQIGGLGWSSYVSLPWRASIPASGNQGCLIAEAQSRHGRNRGLLAFKNQGGDGSLDFQLEYAGAAFHIAISRFAEGRTFTVDTFKETVYFDSQDIPWNQAVTAFTKWYDSEHGLTYQTPEFCYKPAFNSWYPLKREQTEANLLRLAEMTERLGIGTFEIDDGWFRTYEKYDLNTDRIPDMRRLVERFHDHGLRVIAWYSPFHIDNGDALQDLRVVEDGNITNALCVRTREVQDRAGELAGELMRKYNLDGLKVDFLDANKARLVNCGAGHEHVTDFVSEGVHAAMKNMSDAIRGVKSDAIIEYRLNYANVASRRYSTIFRGQDAPSDPDHIRRHLTMLRSWAVGVAPNADYGYWTPDLADEEVARFMAGMVLYGVPTLSVDFDALPASHFAIAKAWLSLYREHIPQLIHGDFQPLSNDAHYSVTRTTSPDHTFAGSFLERWPSVIEIPRTSSRNVFLFNGTAYPEIRTQLAGLSGTYDLEVLDPALKRTGSLSSMSLGDTVFLQEVPIGGSVRLRRQ